LSWSWFCQSVASAQNEDLLHIQNEKLRSDITNLLEYIRQVREENLWDVSGLTFSEVKYEDIFSTVDMLV